MVLELTSFREILREACGHPPLKNQLNLKQLDDDWRGCFTTCLKKRFEDVVKYENHGIAALQARNQNQATSKTPARNQSDKLAQGKGPVVRHALVPSNMFFSELFDITQTSTRVITYSLCLRKA